MLKVFVYGTLQPGKSNYYYCEPYMISVTLKENNTTPLRAYTFGQLFSLPMGYPGLTEGNDKVYGYLLSFANNQVLQDLDDLEGYNSSLDAASNLYNRYLVEVFNLEDASLGSAWAYFMSTDKVRSFKGTYLPDGCW